MFNTGRLEELRNSALIVMKGLKESIINSSTYAEPTIAQAIAVFTMQTFYYPSSDSTCFKNRKTFQWGRNVRRG